MKIQTVRDATIQNRNAKEARILKIERRELIRKVAYWTKQTKKYGGEMQAATLARFQAKLAAL